MHICMYSSCHGVNYDVWVKVKKRKVKKDITFPVERQRQDRSLMLVHTYCNLNLCWDSLFTQNP